MTLAVFEGAVRAHFANAPATWSVQPGPGPWWTVVDNHCAPIDYCPTQSQAEERCHSGPAADRWHHRTDWYLGYDQLGRSLTGPERLIVADALELLSAAAEAFRHLDTVRLVRFANQGGDDERIWVAAPLADGRYQVRGDYLHTYNATDLVFLDDEAADDLTMFLRELLQSAEHYR